MAAQDVRAIGLTSHQLSKLVIDGDMSVDDPLGVLGSALVWGGAERQEKDAVDQ